MDHLDDLEADFLALYGIEDPWSMPAPRFFNLALRTFHYQGTITFRVMEQEQEQGQNRGRVQYQGQEINHNTAAAKMAGLKPGEQVKYVPLTVLMGQLGTDGEYTKTGGE